MGMAEYSILVVAHFLSIAAASVYVSVCAADYSGWMLFCYSFSLTFGHLSQEFI